MPATEMNGTATIRGAIAECHVRPCAKSPLHLVWTRLALNASPPPRRRVKPRRLRMLVKRRSHQDPIRCRCPRAQSKTIRGTSPSFFSRRLNAAGHDARFATRKDSSREPPSRFPVSRQPPVDGPSLRSMESQWLKQGTTPPPDIWATLRF